MLWRSVLCCSFLILLVAHSANSQGCDAKVQLVERAGSWEEGGVPRRIYDMHITNTGVCAFRGTVYVSLLLPSGSSISYSWGYSQSTESVTGFYELAPGQTHSGAGFILAGYGDPQASIKGFSECACGGGNPTPTPTSPPTPTPTDAPTSPPTPAPGTIVRLGLKVLVLACETDDVETSAAFMVMNSVGATWDLVYHSSWGTNNLSLLNADGSGKYYAIIAATELYCWSQAQVLQIETYEDTFNVKTVILYSYPYDTNGVSLAATANMNDATVSFASAFFPYATSVKTDVQVPVTGVYMYPSTISNPNLATAALYVTYPGNAQQYVAAAFINYPNGRKRLEFYIDQADWAFYAIIVGPAWFQWVTNGIFTGARRIELNLQVDDIFMNTGMWDPATHEESETVTYRITPTDLDNTLAWQNSVTARLPQGSHFVLTFPFNGQTVIENGGYDTDPLYLRAKQIRDNFFWESHTFTHPYLDNMTYAKVQTEFTKNNATALNLFDNDLTNPHLCTKSVVTPSISGIFNGNALRAMHDLGYIHIVGDNSRPELLPTNPYHGWYTNQTTHGFAGMYVMPRHATDIYYDASEIINIEQLYNYVYKTNKTFDEIIAANTAYSASFLLAYRHDPFMFHQANLRTITIHGQQTSLLAWWTDRLLDILETYSTLPITSHSHDDLAFMLKAREARDACGFTGTLSLNIDTNQYVSLQGQSTGSCKFGVSGVQGSGSVTNEIVGPEKTMWFDMVPGTPVDITFSTPVSVF